MCGLGSDARDIQRLSRSEQAISNPGRHAPLGAVSAAERHAEIQPSGQLQKLLPRRRARLRENVLQRRSRRSERARPDIAEGKAAIGAQSGDRP